MAKKSKSKSMSFIYGIGMLLAAIGFCLPIFQFKFIGTTNISGFDLVGDGNTAIKIFTLLIFIGAVVGVIAAFVPLPQAKLIKIIALAVSVISFAIVLIMLGNSDGASIVKGLGLGKSANEAIFKHLYVGAYMILGGWILGIVGLVLNK